MFNVVSSRFDVQCSIFTMLKIRNLQKQDGDRNLLESVDLDIAGGELFSLLGPSGSGKTFLLRSVVGFEKPDAGVVFIGDKDVTFTKPSDRNVGAVFQIDALWPHMTIGKSVQLGLQHLNLSNREAQVRAMEALHMVEINGLADKKPRELSNGQQQRAAIARAIVAAPQCLLLDEPFAHLDASQRIELRTLVRRLCYEQGLTVLFVTQDQHEGMSIADRVGILAEGRIHQVGSPAEVYRRPESMCVAGFLGENNFVPGQLQFTGASEGLVATALGEFRGHLSDGLGLREGAEVVLAIRPECWHLDLYPAEENSIVGTIEQVEFFGELARYKVQVGAHQIRVAEANPRYLSGNGSNVFQVWVAPEDVVILPREAEPHRAAMRKSFNS